MANIMINKTCNIRCPYCFASEFVNDKSMNMSLVAFEQAKNFILTSRNKDIRIAIMGGEPLIHPEFEQILVNLYKDTRVAPFCVFTNGILLENYLAALAHPKANMLINFNTSNDIGKAKFNSMIHGIHLALTKFYMRDKITLGINMYKPDFEFEEILNVLREYKFKKLRTSIVVPNTNDKKAVDALAYFKSMKPRVLEFFRELDKIGVVPNFDCNIMPTCILDERELEFLRTVEHKSNTGKLTCNSICGTVIDITPDLQAFRCFGMSDNTKVSIFDFENYEDICSYFYNKFDTFAYNIPTSKECLDCDKRKEMKCMGGCLAFKSKKIQEAYNIITKMTNWED